MEPGGLAAVTFNRRACVDGSAMWRYLERYEPSRIVHALHVGTSTKLGRATTLAEGPATAWTSPPAPTGSPPRTRSTSALADRGEALRNYLRQAAPTSAVFKNFFGRSDETYTNWMRDSRIAKARLPVPNGYLQDNGAGAGASFVVKVRNIPQPSSD